MTDDISPAVRDMMRARAGDIVALRDGFLDDIAAEPSELDVAHGQRRNRRWPLAALGAAAAVVLVAGLAVAVGRSRHDGQPAASSESTGHASACVAALPAAWKQALQPGVLTAAEDGAALALVPGGTVVWVSHPRNEVLLRSGTRSRILYVPPDTARQEVSTAAGDDQRVVLSVTDGGWPVLVVLVDLRSGANRVVTRGSGTGLMLSNVTYYRGAVYWSQEPFGSAAVTIRRYDPNTGVTSSLVTRNDLRGPYVSAAGIEFGGDGLGPPTVAAPLPAVVRTGLGSHVDGLDLATDGFVWAWVNEQGLFWWAGHGPVLRTSVPAVVSLHNALMPLVTAGPFVVLDGYVADMRTGVFAPLPSGDLQAVAGSSGRLLVIDQVAGTTARPIPPPETASVLNTATLPPLSC
jgi:hypothetical protein